MQPDALDVGDYLAGLPVDRRPAVEAVREVVNRHLPEGYAEQVDRGMISWVVPLEDYTDTYNGRPRDPARPGQGLRAVPDARGHPAGPAR